MYLCAMARTIQLKVKESKKELVNILKKQTNQSTISKLQSLILIKDKKVKYSKDLAKSLNYNRHTISIWMQRYKKGGLKELLQLNYVKRTERKLTKDIEKAIEVKLLDAKTVITSYVELLEWVHNKFNKTEEEISYSTLYYHCRTHQSSRLKVSRKTHHKKDEQAERLFKKSS